MTSRRARLLAGGFALLEALIAAGVLGFGLLAVAKLQVNLFGNSDLAKQRTEAVQLGQQKIEDLRAYTLLATYQGIASSSDSVTGTSAAYTRTWTIVNSTITAVAGAYPIYKDIRMVVSWTSRSNTPESITLGSVIAMYDPAASGAVIVPPAGTPTRKPRNRDINIPWPAVKLGDGTSAFNPPGAPSTTAIIFNDTTGAVTGTCTNASLPSTDNTSGSPTSTSSWACTTVTGWLFAGYIGRSSTNQIVHPSLTLTVNTSPAETASLIACFDDAASTPLYTGYVTYACIINTANSHGAWSGRTTFSGTVGAVAMAWGTASSQFAMCRYVQSGGVAYPYLDVKQSLLDQNYILIAGNGTCPTGTVRSYP